MMFTKLRWQVAAVAFTLFGAFSVAQATEEMISSFDAAEAGDFQKAANIWKSLAEKGDAQAQFNLGLMYHGGLGMPRSEKEAVKWYHKAAEGGYSPARVYLVVGYEEGWFGLPQDHKLAYYWRGMLDNAAR